MQAPIIHEDIWNETPELTYYTVRIYNPSGFGVTWEKANVLAASVEDARDKGRGCYRLSQGEMYRMYAFKQETRI